MKKETIIKIDKWFQKVVDLERIIGAIILLIMLIICFAAVVMRYVFVKPIVWSEEVILVLLVIFGYICISIDVYNDAHVALTVLYKRFSIKTQYIFDLIRHILIGAFFALMVNSGWKIYLVKHLKVMAASGWSQGIVFLAQVIAAIMCIVFCIMNFIKTTSQLQSVKKNSEGGEN